MEWIETSHEMVAGVVIERDDEILLIREHGRWTLPKGGVEPGELTREAALREAEEETGLDVELGEIAFVSEIRTADGDQHVQVFYEATGTGTPDPQDPDGEIDDATYVPATTLPEWITYRPRAEPLAAWLDDRTTGYYVFDLQTEPAEIERAKTTSQND
ncbi:NUDIX domain-containing protein [Haloferacaceae archaeon DSL9]